ERDGLPFGAKRDRCFFSSPSNNGLVLNKQLRRKTRPIRWQYNLIVLSNIVLSELTPHLFGS
ncbi:MAG: hypothetical protein NTX50_25245, partial [Candidatus Sumerlaeota bacterium]|nr:hypothetical protein [Candidatus Sumerlaeota bacterium]